MSQNSFFSSDWIDVVAEGRNDIVFEEKNRVYGAYALRKGYNRTIILALTISVSSFLFFIGLPKIIEFFSKTEQAVVTGPTEVQIDLTEPPPIDESEPPPPPPPPPPVLETIKFTPPVVVDEVIEEIPPVQEKLSETNVGEVTQEGTGGDEIIIPEEKGTGVVETKDEIFTVVEQMPGFLGGDAELMKFIQKNIIYPAVEKEAGISGTAYITFVVDKDGKIQDVKILKGVSGGPNCDKEAMRVVKSMPPWKPGKQNGRPVSVQFNLPIHFVLR